MAVLGDLCHVGKYTLGGSKLKRSLENGQERRFRIADWVALILAIVVFLGALCYYAYSKRTPVERAELICVFWVTGIEVADWSAYRSQWVRVGDRLYSSNGVFALGTLESVSQKPHLQLTVRDSEPTWEAHPYLVDLEISVRISATYRADDGLRAGDLRIAAGERGEFRFGNLLTEAEILEVREAVTA